MPVMRGLVSGLDEPVDSCDALGFLAVPVLAFGAERECPLLLNGCSCGF